MIGLLGGPPVFEQFNLMSDVPAAIQICSFPRGLLGTPALPMAASRLPWLAAEIADRRVPSIRTKTLAFDEVPGGHSLMTSGALAGW
jgi:hypothetical protein